MRRACGRLWWMMLVAVWLVAACAAPGDRDEGTATGVDATLQPAALAGDDRVSVVATTSIVADIVRQVGGEWVSVSTLLPPGADPHAFEPTPRDIAAVSEAHAVFANGAGLEEFIERVLRNAAGDTPVVYLSEGIALRAIQDAPDDEHAETHDHGNDPHTWTSPANGLVFVRNTMEALSALDPDHAADYAARAAAYSAELEALDRWIAEQVATIPEDRRLLVTDHLVFGYYADRYGLRQVGAVISGFSTGSAPSARELAELEDAVRALAVPAVFASATVNQDLASRVAEDTGVTLATLYTGALGPDGSGADSYLGYLRANTEIIVAALR